MKLINRRYIGEKTIYYYDDFMALDTETSHTDDVSWISSIQVYFLNKFHLFRKPIDFINFLNEIIERYEIYEFQRLIVIIHNASYDLSYLIGYFQLYLPYKDKRSVIMRDKHNIVCYRQGGVEIRDSYALCNKSLEKWGKDLNIEHQKQVGLYDYTKIIYQDSELTDNEIKYDEYDVLSLYECFQKQMEIENDSIATVPYTSTGYVRRDTEKFCRKDKYYRKKYFTETKLNLEMFNMCLYSFAGGYTHNNRFYNGKIIKGLIGHRDFRSMYPSALRCYPLPFGKPFIFYDVFQRWKSLKVVTIKDVLNMFPEYSTISMIRIKQAILNDEKISMPFMQYAKMTIIKQDFCIKDNGRVLSFKGDAIMYVDNYMLKILTEQYNMKVMLLKCVQFKNEYIPECLANLIDYYFKLKSDLKIEWKEKKKQFGEFAPETSEANINMMLAKMKLNGIYGMFVQNPLNDEFDVDYESEEITKIESIRKLTDDELSDKLEAFYKNRKKYLPYQVGCFVTAISRYELYEYIKTIGYDDVYYCDTDSIFYNKTDEIESRIEELNKIKHENAIKRKAFITDSKGNKIYYDVFESEDDLKMFKGLHSKCYGMVTNANDFICTIAGIPAKTLIKSENGNNMYLTREEELSGITKEMKILNPEIKVDNLKAIQNLKDGFKFQTNTGTTCNYDKFMYNKEKEFLINGHIINTFGGGVISKLESKEVKDMDLFNIRGERIK